jgi:hypothetical protein
MSIRKIVNVSLALLISISQGASAMERDYHKILQEIEDLTSRIHAEVDRVLADYRRDTEEYHRRMGAAKRTATTTSPTAETERKPVTSTTTPPVVANNKSYEPIKQTPAVTAVKSQIGEELTPQTNRIGQESQVGTGAKTHHMPMSREELRIKQDQEKTRTPVEELEQKLREKQEQFEADQRRQAEQNQAKINRMEQEYQAKMGVNTPYTPMSVEELRKQADEKAKQSQEHLKKMFEDLRKAQEQAFRDYQSGGFGANFSSSLTPSEKLQHLKTLNLGEEATWGDIRKVYLKLSSKFHPDKPGGDEEKFKRIKEAYDALNRIYNPQDFVVNIPGSHLTPEERMRNLKKLGLTETATWEDIEAAFESIPRDENLDKTKFRYKMIKRAYDALKGNEGQ